MNIDFKVSIRCMTYNQAAYIEDAMNGFCMQQTDFPFVCNVMDDASTDGEQNVIEKYLECHFDLDDNTLAKKDETDDYKLIFARHKENKNCYFAVFFLKYNHYRSQETKNKKLTYFSDLESKADYVAFCEGDDCWIDSSKLADQVCALEDNQVTICHSGFFTVDSKGKDSSRPFFDLCMNISHNGNILASLFGFNYIMTLTTCVKKDIFNDVYYKNVPIKMDYALFFAAAFKGKAVYIPQKTGCYRNNPNSMINSRKLFVENALWEVYKYSACYYINKYKEKQSCKFKVGVLARILPRLVKHNEFRLVAEMFKKNKLLFVVVIPVSVYLYIRNRVLLGKVL